MIFSPAATKVLEEYEARIASERASGPRMGDRDDYLLPVGPEVGAFLHSLILAKRPAVILELGTSYGYSTLFMANAARQVGARVVTMDLADYKQDYAKDCLERAGLADVVEFRLGDAVALIGDEPGSFDLVLLDIWKDLYTPCLEAFYPKLADEAVIVADNMIRPENAREDVRVYRAAVKAKPDLQTALLPIGSGIELSVKWSAGNPNL